MQGFLVLERTPVYCLPVQAGLAVQPGQISLALSWQKETAKTGPKVKILTPAPMPTATRARFFPGEDRTALSDCDTEAQRIIKQLNFK